MSDVAATPAHADAAEGAPVRGARKRKTVEFYKPPTESGKTAGTDSAVKEASPDHTICVVNIAIRHPIRSRGHLGLCNCLAVRSCEGF